MRCQLQYVQGAVAHLERDKGAHPEGVVVVVVVPIYLCQYSLPLQVVRGSARSLNISKPIVTIKDQVGQVVTDSI